MQTTPAHDFYLARTKDYAVLNPLTEAAHVWVAKQGPSVYCFGEGLAFSHASVPAVLQCVRGAGLTVEESC